MTGSELGSAPEHRGQGPQQWLALSHVWNKRALEQTAGANRSSGGADTEIKIVTDQTKLVRGCEDDDRSCWPQMWHDTCLHGRRSFDSGYRD